MKTLACRFAGLGFLTVVVLCGSLSTGFAQVADDATRQKLEAVLGAATSE